MTFRLNIASVEGYVVLEPGGVPMDADGGIDIRVKNLYDDVLSDPEQIRVDVRIWQTLHPERQTSFQLGREALQDPSMILGGMVIIRPGQELRLLKQWSHSFGPATPFWSVADSSFPVVLQGDKTVTTFRVYYTASVSVRIFRTRPTMYSGARSFTVDYRAP